MSYMLIIKIFTVHNFLIHVHTLQFSKMKDASVYSTYHKYTVLTKQYKEICRCFEIQYNKTVIHMCRHLEEGVSMASREEVCDVT